MPYELRFAKSFSVPEDTGYWNDVCWGGDVVSDQLVPAISSRFKLDIANQEDWGWFIWFRRGSVSLAIDILCTNREQGRFLLHLVSARHFLWFRWSTDTPELEEAALLTASVLSSWTGQRCVPQHVAKLSSSEAA